MSIIQILLVMTLFLWGLTLLPVQQVAPYSGFSRYFAFIVAVLLTLAIYGFR